MDLKELIEEVERLLNLNENHSSAWINSQLDGIRHTVEAVDICHSDGYGLNQRLNPYYNDWQKIKELLQINKKENKE